MAASSSTATTRRRTTSMRWTCSPTWIRPPAARIRARSARHRRMPGTLGGTSGISNGSSGSIDRASAHASAWSSQPDDGRQRHAARAAHRPPRSTRPRDRGRGRRPGARGRRSDGRDRGALRLWRSREARRARPRRRRPAPGRSAPCHTLSRTGCRRSAAGQKSLNPAGPATTRSSSGLPRPHAPRTVPRARSRRGGSPPIAVGTRRIGVSSVPTYGEPGGLEAFHEPRDRRALRPRRGTRTGGPGCVGERTRSPSAGVRAPSGAATSMPPAPQWRARVALRHERHGGAGLREAGRGGQAGEPGPDDDDVSARHRSARLLGDRPAVGVPSIESSPSTPT